MIKELLADLSDAEIEALLYDWRGVWARPNQIAPPGNWSFWMMMMGRGYGKTRSGAEWAKEQLEQMPGCRLAIVARTAADAKLTCVEGESGLLACFPPSQRQVITDRWNRSQGEGTLPNGSMWKCFTSEEPATLRGPQFHVMWADEMAHWEKQRIAWEQVAYTVRLPWDAAPERAGRVMITTTPLPVKEIRDLLKDTTCVVTRGSTFENWHNLNAIMKAKAEKLRGTRMGRQELLGDLLEDVPGALWTRALIEQQRVPMPPLRLSSSGETEFDFVRIVVAVDPAVSSGEDSAETGIVVAARGANGKRYVLEDRTVHGKPHTWAAAACNAYHHWKADRVVAEANNGGELVESNIKSADKNVPVKLVHASQGKRTRAEPQSTAYEAGDVHHVGSALEQLEDQLCTWDPLTGQKSPDRLDALVWALTELEGEGIAFA